MNVKIENDISELIENIKPVKSENQWKIDQLIEQYDIVSIKWSEYSKFGFERDLGDGIVMETGEFMTPPNTYHDDYFDFIDLEFAEKYWNLMIETANWIESFMQNRGYVINDNDGFCVECFVGDTNINIPSSIEKLSDIEITKD